MQRCLPRPIFVNLTQASPPPPRIAHFSRKKTQYCLRMGGFSYGAAGVAKQNDSHSAPANGILQLQGIGRTGAVITEPL